MVTTQPMRPEDESSKRSWISGVWDWYSVSGKSKAKSMSIGIERRRGEAVPHVKRFWVKAEGRWAAGEVWSVIAGWTKSVTMVLVAEASVLLEAGLVWLRIWRDHFLDRGQRSMVCQGVVFINIVQVHWKAYRVCLFAVMVLVAGCPLPAWAFVTCLRCGQFLYLYLFICHTIRIITKKCQKICRKKWRGGLKETIELMLIRPPQLQFFEDGIKITATDTK